VKRPVGAVLVLLLVAAAGLVAAVVPPPAGARAIPSVTGVSPRHGKLDGGTRVRVTGSGFTRVREVRFGAVPGAAVRVAGPTVLYVTTPAHAAGRVHVRVVTAAGASAVQWADRYIYAPAPQVVLDPGHNGGNASHPAATSRLVYAGYGRYKACNTTGTATDAGYAEHRFTWRVALLVRRILVERGIKVILTRSSDAGVGPCVNRRAAIESTPGTAVAVAIHADGAPSSGHGFHVNEDSRRPERATRATVRHSHRLARMIHDALTRGSGLVPSTYIGRNGYYYRDDLAGLNLSTSPTTFLELGNMRNAHDSRLQSSAGGRHRIARAVAVGILAYLGW
jgi:N-acetylmuramoyl-L-alanine amidase